MPLGLDDQESANSLDILAHRSPAGIPQPGFFQGALTGLAQGIGSGAAKIGQAATDATVSGIAGAVGGLYAPPEQDLGYASNFIPSFLRTERSPEQIAEDVRVGTAHWTQKFQPDPHTVGTAGQILHGVTDVGSRFVAGTLAGGPLAGAALAGVTEGYSAKRTAETEGMDHETANRLGMASALFTAAGSLLPGGVGSQLAKRVASGVALNTAMGAANRGVTHSILADAGYTAQAAQYRVLDGEALATDTILGAFFGTLHKDPTSKTFHVEQSVVDSAHTVNDSIHAEIDVAPGIPTTQESRNAHVDNLVGSVQKLLNDEKVGQLKDVEALPNKPLDAIRESVAESTKQEAESLQGDLFGKREPYTEIEVSPKEPAKPAADLTKPEETVATAKETQSFDALPLDIQESANQAKMIIDQYPDISILHPDTGEAVTAKSALENSIAELKTAEQDATLHRIAAACFARG